MKNSFKLIGKNEKLTRSPLGRIIRKRRKKLRLSLRQLALKVGVTKATLSYVELGQVPLNRGDDLINALARILKLDVTILKAAREKRKLKQKSANPGTLGGFLTAPAAGARFDPGRVGPSR